MNATLQRASTQSQKMATFPITPKNLRNRVLDVDDTLCPFHFYVGNEDAVNTALNIAKLAFEYKKDMGAGGKWHEPVWACTRDYPVRMLLTGPRSVGKTTFARHYAAIVSIDWDNTPSVVGPESSKWKLPWIELDGSGLKRRDEILTALEMGCRAKGLPMFPIRVQGGVRHYRLPPLNLFVDEVHCLPRLLMEGFLKMTERDDGILEVGVNIKVDCRQATFIFGTTNPGALKDTLLSRFPLRLDLKQHTLQQVAKIIQNAHNWPMKDCLRLAELKPLPREALAVSQLIADTLKNERCSLAEAMSQWTANLSLRQGGLTDKAVEVMVALAEAQPQGMSKANLCTSLAVEQEEFQNQLLPQLLRTATHPAYVSIAGRHKITKDGLAELRKRGYNY